MFFKTFKYSTYTVSTAEKIPSKIKDLLYFDKIAVLQELRGRIIIEEDEKK